MFSNVLHCFTPFYTVLNHFKLCSTVYNRFNHFELFLSVLHHFIPLSIVLHFLKLFYTVLHSCTPENTVFNRFNLFLQPFCLLRIVLLPFLSVSTVCIGATIHTRHEIHWLPNARFSIYPCQANFLLKKPLMFLYTTIII